MTRPTFKPFALHVIPKNRHERATARKGITSPNPTQPDHSGHLKQHHPHNHQNPLRRELFI
jgi:hypothetical protein